MYNCLQTASFSVPSNANLTSSLEKAHSVVTGKALHHLWWFAFVNIFLVPLAGPMLPFVSQVCFLESLKVWLES